MILLVITIRFDNALMYRVLIRCHLSVVQLKHYEEQA